MDFHAKKVLITGGSVGIGYEAARLFALAGADVAINGVSDRGEQAARELREETGGRIVFLQGDVADGEVCLRLIEDTVNVLGGLDVLVNNAGLVPTGTALTATEEEFDRAWAVNVRGAFFLSKYAIEYMKAHGGGAIVNTGSIAGLIGPKNRAIYAATKGALISMTRAMASDHVREGIRVNCVCPGMVMSPSLRARIDAMPDPAAAEEGFKNAIPIGRIGNAREPAQLILTAASDETAFMTGSILTIDGGASL